MKSVSVVMIVKVFVITMRFSQYVHFARFVYDPEMSLTGGNEIIQFSHSELVTNTSYIKGSFSMDCKGKSLYRWEHNL